MQLYIDTYILYIWHTNRYYNNNVCIMIICYIVPGQHKYEKNSPDCLKERTIKMKPLSFSVLLLRGFLFLSVHYPFPYHPTLASDSVRILLSGRKSPPESLLRRKHHPKYWVTKYHLTDLIP